ncbi:MAG: MarR family winged helix-turn-helix transcriptional regulator [Bacillota bacterium]
MNELTQGGFLIAKIHQLAGRIFSKKLKEYQIEEINAAQGRIMCVLWRNDGISIQELSEVTSLGKSTLTSMLDRLEASGHLKRVHSKNDRRKILIKLTEKNDTVRLGYERVAREMADIFYKGFSDYEIEEFEEYLKRVFNNLEESEKGNR